MLFEHAEDPRRELCRIERDGLSVTVHHHRAGEDGRVEVFDHESLLAARAEYDRQIVGVYERGYRIVRDWVDPPLAHDATLEAMIAEDPDDDARWMVLADWVLTRDDVRADIVRFEQNRRSRDPAESFGQYPVQLFGGEHEAALLTDPLSRGEWHAGHVRACSLVASDGVIEAFATAPATRLVRDLRLECATGADLSDALDALASAPCTRVLRRLAVEIHAPSSLAVLDPILARAIAPRLETLGLALHHEQALTEALDRIADSALRAQLQHLELGKIGAPISILDQRYGTRFVHLASLKLRKLPGDDSALREPRS